MRIPLKKFMEDNGLDDFEHIKICPKCGDINFSDHIKDGALVHLKCRECNTMMVQTDIPCEGFHKNFTVETEREYTAEIANKYGEINFSKKCMMLGSQNYTNHHLQNLPQHLQISHTVHTVIQQMLQKYLAQAVLLVHFCLVSEVRRFANSGSVIVARVIFNRMRGKYKC